VFDGRKVAPYVEGDPTGPINVYGRSKLEGEQRVAAGCKRHVILRTSWVFSPYGHNFVKTMLRLAAARPSLTVVDDQVGCPTCAPHLADAILKIALHINSAADPAGLWGIYHAAGRGEATWYGFAREVFQASAKLGGPSASVTAITTADYPTPARRPQNSRLDGTKLATTFGVVLPDWRLGVQECVSQVVTTS
jgi:dTDP-4-dehydrorhamnose reductase